MPPKRQKLDSASSSRPRKGSSRGNPNLNPYGIEFKNDEQRDRYNVLVKRKIACTRYMDNTVLEALGLNDDFNWMLEQVGWTHFFNLRYPTYVDLTLEFLSSIECNILQGEGCTEGQITFRLLNIDHSFDLAQFNAIFGLPAGGYRKPPPEFHDSYFWSLISYDSPNFKSSNIKASFMPNPYFRYLHRIMANTLFGRGDSDGNVRIDELAFMWAIFNNVKMDTGSFLVRHLLKVGRAQSGSIVVGGLITAIAEFLEYDLAGREMIKGNNCIDLELCLAIKMIVKEDGTYCLPLRHRRTPLPLPNPDAVTIHNPANWRKPGAEVTDPINVQHPLRPTPRVSASGPSSSSFAGTSEDSLSRILASLDKLEAGQEQQNRAIEEIRQQTQAMYNWHLNQHHFPPPQ